MYLMSILTTRQETVPQVVHVSAARGTLYLISISTTCQETVPQVVHISAIRGYTVPDVDLENLLGDGCTSSSHICR